MEQTFYNKHQRASAADTTSALLVKYSNKKISFTMAPVHKEDWNRGLPVVSERKI